MMICSPADIHASSKTSSVPTEKPVTASYFYIAASGTEDPPFPAYTYDEVSIVLEGALVLKDETGTSYVLKKGDTFLVTKGSVVSFNTEDYALCWKVGGRWMGEY